MVTLPAVKVIERTGLGKIGFAQPCRLTGKPYLRVSYSYIRFIHSGAKHQLVMFRILLCLSVSALLFIRTSSAQNDILKPSNDPVFLTFFKEFVKTNTGTGSSKRGVPALFFIKQTDTRIDAGITMLTVLSEFENRKPSGYTYINNRLTLLYDGTQHIFPKDTSYIAKLRILVKEDLCDDTKPLPKLSDSIGREVPIDSECYFKFDPLEWRLTFRDGQLIAKEPLKTWLFDLIKD